MSEVTRGKMLEFIDGFIAISTFLVGAAEINKTAVAIRRLIESHEQGKPKVSREQAEGLIGKLVGGPLWFRGPLPEVGKAADIVLWWLTEAGVEVEDG